MFFFIYFADFKTLLMMAYIVSNGRTGTLNPIFENQIEKCVEGKSNKANVHFCQMFAIFDDFSMFRSIFGQCALL